jgi:Fe-S cluster biosynthesis and repair protein YggX
MTSNIRMVNCKKLGKQAAGLKSLPLPGELGNRIYNEISQEAFDLWLKQQTMLINEKHLNLTIADDRQFLRDNMQAFLFNDTDVTPSGYTPKK